MPARSPPRSRSRRSRGPATRCCPNSTEVGKAHALAISVAKKNYPDASWAEDGTWKVACDPKLKVVTVQFGNSGITDAQFSGVFGGSKKITTSRTAEATIDVAPGAGESVRPLALCSAAVGNSVPGQFVQIFYPGNGTKSPPQCPKPSTPGNWWTLDCPEERTGATGTLQDEIQDGCKSRVTVIPGQADANTPGALTVTLEAACPSAPSGSETCMSGDPGSLDAGHIADAWKYLVDTQKVSIFPVFCVSPQCSDDTSSGQGTNSVFPVYKLRRRHRLRLPLQQAGEAPLDHRRVRRQPLPGRQRPRRQQRQQLPRDQVHLGPHERFQRRVRVRAGRDLRRRPAPHAPHPVT